jgi:hypothetical protein
VLGTLAGFLLDFDEKQAIVFGVPEPVDLDAEELEGLDAADLAYAADLESALERCPLAFLQSIAPRWPGWLLHWDDRGVEAFSAHLRRRELWSIATQPDRHPADRNAVSFQA